MVGFQGEPPGYLQAQHGTIWKCLSLPRRPSWQRYIQRKWLAEPGVVNAAAAKLAELLALVVGGQDATPTGVRLEAK